MTATYSAARLLVLIALGAGCDADPPDPAPADADPSSAAADPSPAEADLTPAQLFTALEERLLERTHTALAFRITSEGAFSADLAGDLVIGEGDDIRLMAEGTFGDDTVSPSLRVRDGRMVGGNADQRFDDPVPAALRESIILGLTRMGLLHTLARLVSGSPPDHAGGGVEDWVRPANVIALDVGQGVAFEVMVDGQETGSAVLRVDDRGLPASRAQTVRFPGGEMRVQEAYDIPDEPEMGPAALLF